MKKLFICCDGTWNSPGNVQDGISVTTNVHRFYSALAPQDSEGREQRRYYHPGVGTDGGKLRRALDGASGTGLSQHIKGAYKWLAQNFEEGDLLYLLGFSRGAYTVRSLGGIISRFGILPPGSGWEQVDAIYEAYRQSAGAGNQVAIARPESQNIHFIGVWDTVGALGIPSRLQGLPLPLSSRVAKRNSFHDTRLSARVKHAFHALAVDEQREDFQPTLWSNAPAAGQQIEQVWFAGVHADIGGGYKERELASITLDWMMDNATACGAVFTPDMRGQAKPASNSYQGSLHDSYVGVFELSRSLPRTLPDLMSPDNLPIVHESVRKRIEQSPIGQACYRPSHVLKVGEKSQPVTVFAKDRWNFSGLYLEAGEYQFSATGQWLDLKIKSGPAGSDEGRLRQLGSGLKRLDGYKWLELVGCVANQQYDTDRTDQDVFKPERKKPGHQDFPAWDGARTVRVERPGYLYFFGNDVWQMYWNNAGSVEVVVSCLSQGQEQQG